MISGAHVVLYSADREFFREVLGLPFVDAGNGWLIFALPPAELAVHPAIDGAGTQQLMLMCDDIHALANELAAHGTDTTEPREQRSGPYRTSPYPVAERSASTSRPTHHHLPGQKHDTGAANPQGLTRACTSGSLLVTDVEVQAGACRDRVDQGLQLRRRGPAGPCLPPALQHGPGGEPGPDRAQCPWPGRRRRS